MFPRVRTFTQEIADNETLTRMRGDWEGDENTVFFGFAHYLTNVDLPGYVEGPYNVAYGTTYGISEPTVEVVVSRPGKCFRSDAWHARGLKHLKCGDLFDEYSGYLTEN